MLAIALVHYPTVNRDGRVVTTSVTNFDIHDIARAACTFGLSRYYIVTPVELQQQYTRRIIVHWIEGAGGDFNPTRREALGNVEVVSDLMEVGHAIERDFGRQPTWIATSARPHANPLRCERMREMLAEKDACFCMIFGTGSGLHPQVVEEADYTLEPINGPTPYNHLSVRSAVSIYLDRLLGVR